MTKPLRVLQVTGSLGYGGVPLMLRTFYGVMDHSSIRFDFLHHGKDEDYHDELQKNDSKIISIPTLGSIGKKAYVSKLRHVLLTEGPYDIIHIHTNYQAGIVANVAHKVGIKVRIVHIRGVDVPSVAGRIMMPYLKYLIKRHATHRFAVSSQAGKMYFGAMPFVFFPSAVDLTKFFPYEQDDRLAARSKLNLPNYKGIICQIGRLSKEKNYLFTVEIARELRNLNKEFILLIIGEGPMRDAINAKIHELNLENDVIMTGQRSNIPEYLNASNLMLLPSVSEGLPNVLLQAQATGLPSIVSDTVTKEVDVGLGLLHYLGIEDGNANTWAVKAAELLVHPPSLVQNTIAQRISDGGFSLEIAAKKLESFYLQSIQAEKYS